MARVSGARHRKRSSFVFASWLFVGGDTPFKAGLALLWVVIFLVMAALTLDWLFHPDNFPVENVNFEGRFQHVTREQLVRATKGQVHGNFFALDLDTVKGRVEALPWVHRASVRRAWPRDLHIRFTEQQLAARWGDDAWLNDTGELVRLGKEPLPVQLPQLRGPEGTHAQVLARHRRFERALAPLGLHVTAVTLTSRRTWQVRLHSGIAFVLAREDPETKIERFVRAYPHALARHEGRIKQVDLRYTNGFSVEWIEPPPVIAEAY